MRVSLSIVFCLTLTAPSLWAADPQSDEKILYKEVGDVKLHLHAFLPQGHMTFEVYHG